MKMKKLSMMAVVISFLSATPAIGLASPEQDLKYFRELYMRQFPGIPLDEFKNGVYAIDSDSRISWEANEEFPPYDDALAKGKKLFNTPFANGKTYASCFRNGGIGIRQDYPYFDSTSGEVKTLELEINECRQKNGEKPLDYMKGDMAAISAYMASTSNGKPFDIKVPDDPRAQAWYQKGKEFYYSKRGQLNMACANCHVDNVGKRVRAEILSPLIGQPTHFPVHRMSWGELGTLNRRYDQCMSQIRAKPYKPQSPEFRALEYFQTYMSNGISINAPSSRK